DGLWSGIYLQAGRANIGTTAGNTVGSGTGTGSVSVLTGGGGSPGGMIFGIVSASNDTIAIVNNTIGSMTTNCTTTNITLSLTGIQVTGGTNTISGNTVGSTTTVNSLSAATFSTALRQKVTGISSSNSTSTAITNNAVANLNNNYSATSAGSQIVGISAGLGVNSITGNTIRNLSTKCLINAGTTAASAMGIVLSTTTAGQTVSQNIISSLSNTEASAPTSVTGIYYNGASSGTNVIARNFIYGLAVSSGDAASAVTGMEYGSGSFTVHNNMIRIGLDTNGNNTAGAANFTGIADFWGASNGRNYYYNSVYLGGTQTSGASGTIAFSSTGSTNTRAFRNNIFVNARSNGGGTGGHYAVQYFGNTTNPPGLTASNNILYVSGTGGVLGFYNSAARTTLAAWQAATGVDAGSINASPAFANPTGDATTIDLHLQTPTPANSAGTPIAAVAIDFDGQPRSATTPDIGADELSTDADLSNLSLSAGTLAPAFASSTTSYTASVTNGTTTLTFTPTVSSSLAAVTVNGGSASTPVPLNVGTNNVSIRVTAQDGTVKIYTVTVTRWTGLETWRSTYFGTTDNTGNAADSADPYHTGVQNLAVFAVLGPNQDPAKVAANLLPQPQRIGGNYVITFTQPTGVSGVTYSAEWKADLSAGSWTPITQDTGSGNTHTFSVPIGVNPKIFLRLKVSSP
ncbi:MAG: cadherin-like beta sandwich domain-containing protein, partial [Chthoniobacteraceae bacterium]